MAWIEGDRRAERGHRFGVAAKRRQRHPGMVMVLSDPWRELHGPQKRGKRFVGVPRMQMDEA